MRCWKWLKYLINLQRTFSGFKLSSERKYFSVFWIQVIRRLGKNEDLRPPILSVRRTFFQAKQRIPSCWQSKTSDSVTPFFLGPKYDCIYFLKLEFKSVSIRNYNPNSLTLYTQYIYILSQPFPSQRVRNTS